MTELTSSRLGAAFEMILINSERRSVPVMLGVAMGASKADSGIVSEAERPQ